jgi:hypothetical protein
LEEGGRLASGPTSASARRVLLRPACEKTRSQDYGCRYDSLRKWAFDILAYPCLSLPQKARRCTHVPRHALLPLTLI